jgi:hypothetical protein
MAREHMRKISRRQPDRELEDFKAMCRNIRVLYNFEPPTTQDEITAAALQFVRKVTGVQKPSALDEKTFNDAIAAVAATTSTLLASMHAKAPLRTREGEREKARMRFLKRSNPSR